MSLIACPECHQQISDQAAACPHCGRPLPAAAVGIATKGRQVVTTQATAKIWKFAQIVGAILATLGAVSCSTQPDVGYIGGLISLLGFIIFISARIGAWWRHG